MTFALWAFVVTNGAFAINSAASGDGWRALFSGFVCGLCLATALITGQAARP